MDRDIVERDWARRGFTCSIWIDTPGAEWNDYAHEMDELVMVIEGDVEFDINGKIHHPQPGEELFIPAHTVHSVRNLGGTSARWFYGYKSNR